MIRFMIHDPVRDPILDLIRDPTLALIRDPIRDLIHNTVREPIRDPIRSDPIRSDPIQILSSRMNIKPSLILTSNSTWRLHVGEVEVGKAWKISWVTKAQQLLSFSTLL